MTFISDGAPAHEAPTENGDVREALPYSKGADDINVWFVDLALPGGRYVRYRSDARHGPGAGFWRTYGTQPPERISPFAITGITPGRHGIEVEATLPGGRDPQLYEGSLDDIASDLHRAGRRRGCRADRQTVFWALTDLCNEIRRQQAARGVQV